MKKIIFTSLLLTLPLCKAADTDYTKINKAISYNDLNTLRDLIGEGVINLNAPAIIMPLHQATSNYLFVGNNMPILQLLLDHGADPLAQTTDGISSLDGIKVAQTFGSNELAMRKQELIALLEGHNPSLKPAKKS